MLPIVSIIQLLRLHRFLFSDSFDNKIVCARTNTAHGEEYNAQDQNREIVEWEESQPRCQDLSRGSWAPQPRSQGRGPGNEAEKIAQSYNDF